MNLEQARFNMVEQQIRPWEVLDPDVLALLFKVKREMFVPPEHREIAFADPPMTSRRRRSRKTSSPQSCRFSA